MVLRQFLWLAAAGCASGAFAALAVARIVAHKIPGFDPFDAGGYAQAASWIPARKAINTDAATTLHCN